MLKAYLEQMADALPIIWDRFVEVEGIYFVYGWILRVDGSRNFILLDVHIKNDKSLDIGFITSSSTYSAAINQYLYGEKGEHVKCQKFENMIV